METATRECPACNETVTAPAAVSEGWTCDTCNRLSDDWEWEFLEDNGDALICSRKICDHAAIDLRRHGDGPWWSEVVVSADDWEGDSHIRGFDYYGDSPMEIIEAIGSLDDLDPTIACRYCSGAWPLPKEGAA